MYVISLLEPCKLFQNFFDRKITVPSQSVIEDNGNKLIEYVFKQPVKKFLTDCFHNERLFFVHYVHSMNLTHKHTFEN